MQETGSSDMRHVLYRKGGWARAAAFSASALRRLKVWLGQEKIVAQSYALLRVVFFAGCLLFPLGKAFQVGAGVAGLVLLAAYYTGGYARSNLARLPFRWIFAVFFLYPFAATIFSQWPGHSFGYTRHILHESLVFFFMGLECIRSSRDMRTAGVCLLLAVFGQGADGIWQFVTGYDLVKGTPVTVDGRLTGSMGTYRVGNYLAIAMVPALLTFWALPRSLSVRWRSLFVAAVSVPPFFVLVMSQTRSAMLGLVGALYCYAVLCLRVHRRLLMVPPVLLGILLLAGPDRIRLSTALRDGRWELWEAAWRIFREHMWFGTGASTFNPAFNSMGITLVINDNTIPHPHGIFVQFLSDGGIAGFLLLAGVLAGIGFIWCGIRVWKGVRAADVDEIRYWRMAGLLWAGFAAYLGTGVFGHNFYRTWWLAMGLMMFGCVMGAVVSAGRCTRGEAVPHE
jgi:O-antigen ligase